MIKRIYTKVGGACAPVTLDLDGDPLDPTPSGGNRSIKLIDQFDNLLIPTSVVDSPTETTIKVSAVGSIGFITIPFLDIPTVADGDEGYLFDNYAAFNPYVAPFNAVLPVLDPSDPYAKLLTDNRFGSKWRYTGVTGGYYDNGTNQYKDVTGVVTTAALAFPMSGGQRYGIDHYHNIGRKLTREAQAVWTTSINRDINATYGGLDRWRTNTLAEMNALANVQDALGMVWDTPPFAYNANASSCTVVASNPTNHYQSQTTGYATMAQQANTAPVITYVCRNHYTI